MIEHKEGKQKLATLLFYARLRETEKKERDIYNTLIA